MEIPLFEATSKHCFRISSRAAIHGGSQRNQEMIVDREKCGNQRVNRRAIRMATATEYDNAIPGLHAAWSKWRNRYIGGKLRKRDKEGRNYETRETEKGGRRPKVGGSVVLISHIGQTWQRQQSPSTRPI